MDKEKGIPAVQCDQCTAVGIPSLFVCRKCGGRMFKETKLPDVGMVYSHTTIRVAPEAYRDQAPYDIAIVEIKSGLRITARVQSEVAGKVQIGEQVEFKTADENGYWFKQVN